MKEKIAKYVGKGAIVNLQGLRVAVKILDIKERWGRLRYLVSPLSGSGEIWVEHLSIPELDINEKIII